MPSLDSLFFSAELGSSPELNLHGTTVAIALGELDHFLHAHWHHKEPIVRIIHGRGSGTLRQAIHKWLKHQPKMVLAFRDSTRMDEVGAVTYVVFRL